MDTKIRRRIDTWKEIAAFLDRDGRTVQRWEKTRNLPVHRIPGERGGVFAYSDELTDWLNRGVPLEDTPPSAIEGSVDASSPNDPYGFASAQTLPATPHSTMEHQRFGTFLLTPWILAFTAAALLALAVFLRNHGASPAPQVTAVNSSLSTNPQAKEAYLRGRFLWNQRDAVTLMQALELFRKAEQLDPHLAAAFVGEAETYELLPEYQGMSPANAFAAAEKAARQAVALDPNSAAAHRAYAFALFYGEWRAKAAFAEFDRAVTLDPGSSQTHHWYANALMAVNNMDAASKEMQRARELDPASTIMLIDQAFLDFNRGEPASHVIAKLRELANAEPNLLISRRYIATILLQSGRMGEWAAQMAEIARIDKSPADVRAAALMHGLPASGAGDALGQERLCAAREDALIQRAVGLTGLASACMSAHDIPHSVALWQKSFRQRDPQWLPFATHPLPDQLEDNASIRQLRDEVQQQINSPPTAVAFRNAQGNHTNGGLVAVIGIEPMTYGL